MPCNAPTIPCCQATNLLDAHVEGRLCGSLLFELQAHLLACPACRREFQVRKAIADTVRLDRREPDGPDVHFADRILQRVGDRRRERRITLWKARRRAGRQYRTLAGAAMVSTAATFALLVFSPGLSPHNPPDAPSANAAETIVLNTPLPGPSSLTGDPLGTTYNPLKLVSPSTLSAEHLYVVQAGQNLISRTRAVGETLDLIRQRSLIRSNSPGSPAFQPDSLRMLNEDGLPLPDSYQPIRPVQGIFY